MLMNLLTGVVFLLMFSILVAAHELGHYWLARKFNMGVSEFSIGMGNPIVKTWKRKKYKLDDGEEQETHFNIRPLPLGGFVKIIGMEPQEDGSEINVNGGFYTRSPWARIVVLLAGPIFSIVFGWIVLVGLYSLIGVAVQTNRIAVVSIGGAAEKAGILPGDSIIKVDSKVVKNSVDGILAIRSAGGKPVTVTYSHEGQTLSKLIQPTMSKDELEELDANGEMTDRKGHFPVLGIQFDKDYKRVPIAASIVEATRAPYETAKGMVSSILRPKKILEESTGVIGMAVSTRVAVQGGFANVLFLAGLISISLGFMNLLPIGMLDGGQILLSFIEALRGGKRLSLKSQLQFLWAGMFVIIFFFLAVTYKDLFRFVIPGKDNIMTDQKQSITRPDSNAPATNTP